MLVTITKLGENKYYIGINEVPGEVITARDVEVICDKEKIKRKLIGSIKEFIVDAWLVSLKEDGSALVHVRC